MGEEIQKNILELKELRNETQKSFIEAQKNHIDCMQDFHKIAESQWKTLRNLQVLTAIAFTVLIVLKLVE